jgi:vacuolar-type H+-ATPase subunit F/Vma7
MNTVAIVGERALIQGYALVGVHMLTAETAEHVRRHWANLPPGLLLVILTPTAAAALDGLRTARGDPMTVVMPT